MIQNDGQPIVENPALPLEVSGQTPAAPAQIDPALEQFMVQETPASAPAPMDGQPNGQSQTPEQLEQLQRQVRELQSMHNKKMLEAQKEREQYLQALQNLQPKPTQPTNPYDVQVDPVNHLKWEMTTNSQNMLRQAVDEADKRAEERFQKVVRQAGEMQWAQQHPGADIESIKAFNQMNGIAEWNLDAGWKLMNLPNQISQVARNTAQNTFNQFTKPQAGAPPVRASSGNGGIQGGLSYEKLAEAVAKDASFLDRMSPEVRSAFEKETFARQSIYSTGG